MRNLFVVVVVALITIFGCAIAQDSTPGQCYNYSMNGNSFNCGSCLLFNSTERADSNGSYMDVYCVTCAGGDTPNPSAFTVNMSSNASTAIDISNKCAKVDMTPFLPTNYCYTYTQDGYGFNCGSCGEYVMANIFNGSNLDTSVTCTSCLGGDTPNPSPVSITVSSSNTNATTVFDLSSKCAAVDTSTWNTSTSSSVSSYPCQSYSGSGTTLICGSCTNYTFALGSASDDMSSFVMQLTCTSCSNGVAPSTSPVSLTISNDTNAITNTTIDFSSKCVIATAANNVSNTNTNSTKTSMICRLYFIAVIVAFLIQLN